MARKRNSNPNKDIKAYIGVDEYDPEKYVLYLVSPSEFKTEEGIEVAGWYETEAEGRKDLKLAQKKIKEGHTAQQIGYFFHYRDDGPPEWDYNPRRKSMPRRRKNAGRHQRDRKSSYKSKAPRSVTTPSGTKFSRGKPYEDSGGTVYPIMRDGMEFKSYRNEANAHDFMYRRSQDKKMPRKKTRKNPPEFYMLSQGQYSMLPAARFNPRRNRGKLTEEEREDLPARDFVFPKTRRYPINDLYHARKALQMMQWNKVSKEDIPEVKKKVFARYPSLIKWWNKHHPEDKWTKGRKGAASRAGKRRARRRKIAANPWEEEY